MRENPIYTVTPPDMILPDNGPIITVLSSNEDFVHSIEALYENLFKTVTITLCHPGGKVDDKNCAWIISMMRFSDTVYVDLDNLTELGIICAMSQNLNKTIFIVDKTRKSVAKLLNTMPDYHLYKTIEEYADIMLDSFETV